MCCTLTHIHLCVVQMMMGPLGGLWLHQHRGDPAPQQHPPTSVSSFGILTWYLLLLLCLSKTQPLEFFFFNVTFALMHSIQPLPQVWVFCFFVFFCLLSSPVFLLFFFSDFQGQTGQTMPLVSVWMWFTTHNRRRCCLGNTLTINFQLKQTKRWQLRVHGRCQEAVLIYDKWA